MHAGLSPYFSRAWVGDMHRELSGVLVVDKPADMSSAMVVARVKKLLGARKAGHTGTLDPFATGVLLCCINRATKLSGFFLHGKKKYEAVLHLGIETDTQDSTGNITATCDDIKFSEKEIRSAFERFEGTIEQFPPVYSALKFKGIPLYKLARSNRPVQKPARRVSILYIKILEIKVPLIRFEVACSAGTYIRTLCADIGASLGCGGHLKELKRIESSGFTLSEAVTLQGLEDLAVSGKLFDRIIPMSNALKGMPAYIADKVLEKKIMYGNILTKNDLRHETKDIPESFIKILDTNNDLIAVLKCSKNENRYKYRCVLNAK